MDHCTYMGWCAKFFCWSGGEGGLFTPRERKTILWSVPRPPIVRGFSRNCPLPPVVFRAGSFHYCMRATFPFGININSTLPRILSHLFCLLLYDYLPAIVSLTPLHCAFTPPPIYPNLPLISAHSIVSGRTFKLTRPDAKRGEFRCVMLSKGEDISVHRRYGSREGR